MIAVLGFFVRLAPFIFSMLVVGLIIALWRMGRVRAERHSAVFGLEREIANRHMSEVVSALALIGFLALAEFVLVIFLVPNIPALSQLATPTINPLLTPTSTFPLEFRETLGSAQPATTSTAQATGCIPGQIDITSPKPGDQISGSVDLQGTANVPDFGFYKYEFAPVGSDNWATIVARTTVVQDGDLGNWDTSEIATGDYQLRLVVTDNQGNALPACVIPLRIIGK